LSNVNEGRYIVSGIYGIPDGYYISETKLGAHSFYKDGSFEIGNAAPEPMEIVVSRNGGQIKGAVMDVQHRGVADAVVALIPEESLRSNNLLYKNINSSPDGSFTLKGIAPGRYKLFAWRDLIGGAEQNSEFLKAYESMGVSVVISPGKDDTLIQVPIID
jgi:hypothetical protein